MSRPAAKPIPEGYHSLTPFLVCQDASQAIDFYQRALGAEVVSSQFAPDGKLLHAGLRVGDSMLMLTEECPGMGGFSPLHFGGSPVTIHLFVADVDAAFERATAAGATALMPVAEMFWGARYGVFKDPFGHSWSVATQVKDMTPAEIEEAAARAFAAQAAA